MFPIGISMLKYMKMGIKANAKGMKIENTMPVFSIN
jgi:hypothetical protein